MSLETPLSAAEIGELDAFLMSEATSDECMDIGTLDGFLTALVVGPGLVAPSVWLPLVWGGTNEPVFESPEQAERIIGLLLRRMNTISRIRMSRCFMSGRWKARSTGWPTIGASASCGRLTLARCLGAAF